MSRTIMIMRHGKSDWQASYDSDFQRPLNKRGKKSAKAMGRFIAGIKYVPEFVICSSAMRAKATAEIAMETGNWGCAVEFTSQLYEPTVEQLMAYIRGLDDCYRQVMLVGHEPWCSELMQKMTGSHCKFPTAAVAVIELSVESWQQTFGNSGLLTLFIPARPLLAD